MQYFAYILSLLSDRPIFAETWPYRSYLYIYKLLFHIPYVSAVYTAFLSGNLLQNKNNTYTHSNVTL